MVEQLNKLLVAMDGSQGAEKALKFAANLGEATGASLHLLIVHDISSVAADLAAGYGWVSAGAYLPPDDDFRKRIEQEVATALEKERKERGTVLFPIRLDGMVMEHEGDWPALIRNTRNIGDFSAWKDHDAYRQAFDRLLRDLKAAHAPAQGD